MSEESYHSMVTPERSVSPSHGRSTSAFRNRAPISSFSSGNSATRNSTGKSGFINGNQNVASRYLRASTGSCHDHCKSGVRHSFEEEKPRTPVPKRQVNPLPVKLNPVRTKEEEQRHVKVFNHKPSPDRKAKSPYPKTPPDTKSPSPKYDSSSDKKKAVKHRPLLDSRNDHRQAKASLDSETSPGQKRTPLLKNKPSSSKKVSSPDPPEIIKSVIYSSENVVAKVEQGLTTSSETPKSGRKKFSRSCPPSPVNSTPLKDRPVLSSGRSDVRGKERKNSDADASRNMTVIRTSAKKLLSPPASSLPPKGSPVKTGSSRTRKAENSKSKSILEVQTRGGGKNSSIPDDQKVLERTLHMVKTEAGNNKSGAISDVHIVPSFSSPSSPKSEKRTSDSDESLENGNALSICNDLAVSLSQAESPSLIPTEEDKDEIEYDDGELGEFVHENDDSLEIDNVQSVPNGHEVLSILSPLSVKSETESYLSPHEDDHKDVVYHGDESGAIICGNDESSEIGMMLSIPADAVPWLSSSPISSSSLSPHEGDDKEIEYRYSEQDQFIPNNEESQEIDNVSPVSDDPTVSSLASSVSAKPLSAHEEDNKEINYHDDEPREGVFENVEPPEIGNVQSVPRDHTFSSLPLSFHEVDNKNINHHDEDPIESPENGDVQSVPNDLSSHKVDNKEINYHDEDTHESISENGESPKNGNVQSMLDGDSTISSFPSPSPPKSLSHADLSSLSPHEEHKKEIQYHENESSDEYIFENDEPPEIGNMQPDPNGHIIPSLTRSLSYTDFSSLSSLGEEDDDEEIEYIDGELDGLIPNTDEYIENDDLTSAGENHNKTPRRSSVLISEDQDCSPVKLKFKPGRVIDLKSDNNGPKRLRFRRARALSAEAAHSGLKTLKRSGSTGHMTGDTLSSEKVVLKHQDVQDKKDSQILLNNVIEETASKLVESRKSKVKALVGAFETVISLQETKPSS